MIPEREKYIIIGIMIVLFLVLGYALGRYDVLHGTAGCNPDVVSCCNTCNEKLASCVWWIENG